MRKRLTTADLSEEEFESLLKDAVHYKIEPWQPWFVYRTRKLITERGMQMQELADNVGVSQNTLSEHLSKLLPTKPKSDVLFKTAEYFNVSIDYLMGRSQFEDKVFSVKLSNFVKKYGMGSRALYSLEQIMEHHYEFCANDFPVKTLFEIIFENYSIVECFNHLFFAVEMKSMIDKYNHKDYMHILPFSSGKLPMGSKEAAQSIIDLNIHKAMSSIQDIFSDIVNDEKYRHEIECFLSQNITQYESFSYK